MATRLYFHADTDSTSGLPTAEQSSLISDVNMGSQTTNRQMTTNIGSAQTSVSGITDDAAAIKVYFTKFVSPPLNQTSIAANTWTYNFATEQDINGCNFPVNGTLPVWAHCYVWRPSTTTKIGTIRDGNTSNNATEPSADVEKVHHLSFTGSSVSSVQTGDVIIFEVWFQINQTINGSLQTISWYYDGTTANTTPNATVSNHASFIETPENLSFDIGGGINMNNDATKTYANKFITKV